MRYVQSIGALLPKGLPQASLGIESTLFFLLADHKSAGWAKHYKPKAGTRRHDGIHDIHLQCHTQHLAQDFPQTSFAGLLVNASPVFYISFASFPQEIHLAFEI